MVNEKANIQVTLNSQEAQNQLESLQSEMKRLIALKKKAEESGDIQGWRKIDSELKKVNRSATKLISDHRSLEQTLKNINGASLKDLREAQRTLTSQTEKLNRNTQEYVEKSRQLKEVKAEIGRINGEFRQQPSFISRAAEGFNKYFSVITALAASFAGVFLGMRKAITSFNDFEERVSNLSALTGLAGQELNWLSDQAKQLSQSSLEGGIVITQSAIEIVDAFTKVGSARPELLKNKQALVEVTKEAIILGNAAKIELQPAIEALTMVMNQYNVPASESRRIINAIAAGSKEGAGEIPYITTAFEKAGTVAADAGVSIETLVATIETLAPRITAPEIAGRSLKGVILDLQTGADDTNPSIVGFSTAIENLGKKNLSTTQLLKMFGTENITTAKILINNIGELKKYEAAVTGTGTAIEQATVNTDNNNARLMQAKNRLNVISMELGQKLSPAYGSIISKSSLLLKSLVALVDIFTKYGSVILASVTAITAYALVVKIAASWTRIHAAYTVTAGTAQKVYAFAVEVLTGKIKLATAAQRVWNVVQKANPIGLLIGLLAGAGVAIAAYAGKVNSLSMARKKLNEVETTAQENIVEQKLAVEDLLSIAQSEKQSLVNREAALQKLNEISPEYFGNLKLETLNSQKAKEASDQYTESLLQQARVQAARESLIELEKERIRTLQSGSDTQVKWYQTALNGVKSFGNAAAFSYLQASSGAQNAAQADADYLKQREALLGVISQNPSASLDNPNPDPDDDEPTDSTDFEKIQKSLESNFIKEQNILKEQFLLKQITEGQYNSEMYALELAHLVAMRELYRQHNQDFIQIEGQIMDKKLAWQQKFDEMLKISVSVTDNLLAQEQKMFQDIDTEMEKHLDNYSKNLDQATQKTIESELEKQEARQKAKEAWIKSSVEAGAAAVENAETVEEAGKAVLNSIRQQIRAYLAEAVATAALKALKNVPFPLNIAAAAAAGGAATFLFNKIIPEFHSGGFTGNGSKHEPAGIVHRGEWVAPKWMLDDNRVAPVVNALEFYRRNPMSINLAGIKQGFASGGYTSSLSVSGVNPSGSAPFSPVDPSGIASNEAILALAQAVDRLMKWQPRVYTEDIRKGLNNLQNIDDNRGL